VFNLLIIGRREKRISLPSEMPKIKGTRRRRCISGTGGIGQALR
jgi:hypothetical protein